MAPSPSPAPTAAVRPAAGSGDAPLSRRERKKQRTRREIYEAAMELFGRHGFDAVTIEQICEAADVARATFFHHFPTKSALLFEFHRAIAAELALRLHAPRADAVAELRMMVQLVAERCLEPAEVMGAMLREFASTPMTAAELDAEAQDLRELVEGVVRRGQERGEFRESIDARLAAAIFLSTSAAILSGSVYRSDAVTPDEAREQFLEAVLHGLVPYPEARP
jgi:AcrR family transcriptional regulator